MDKFIFQGIPHGVVQESHSQEVIVLEDFPRDTKFISDEADGGDPAPFAIATVAHLLQGLEHVAGGNLLVGRQADDTTAPFGLLACGHVEAALWDQMFSRSDEFRGNLSGIHQALLPFLPMPV
jgi:hypothetical protein